MRILNIFSILLAISLPNSVYGFQNANQETDIAEYLADLREKDRIKKNTLILREKTKEVDAEASRLKKILQASKTENNIINAKRDRVIAKFKLNIAEKHPEVFIDDINVRAVLNKTSSKQSIQAPPSRADVKSPEPVAKFPAKSTSKISEDTQKPIVVEVWGPKDKLNAIIEMPNGNRHQVKLFSYVRELGTIVQINKNSIDITDDDDQIRTIFLSSSKLRKEKNKEALINEIKERIQKPVYRGKFQ